MVIALGYVKHQNENTGTSFVVPATDNLHRLRNSHVMVTARTRCKRCLSARAAHLERAAAVGRCQGSPRTTGCDYDNGPVPRVFLSHASSDRLRLTTDVLPLLERHGIGTWFSPKDIRTAEEWEVSIRNALEACDWFLVALSPEALTSAWVRTEVEWAAERRPGRIVPVILRSCDLSSIHQKLRQIQHVDFTKPSDDACSRLLSAWSVTYQPLPRTQVQHSQSLRDRVSNLEGYSLDRSLGRHLDGNHVFLMRSARLNKPVIVKVVPMDEPEAASVVMYSAREQARVQHPAVVAVYEIREADGLLFIATECIVGSALTQLMRGSQQTSIEQVTRLTADIAEGLHAAHSLGVLHLGLTPGHIILDEHELPHVTDFALPRWVMGTPSYCSPEWLLAGVMDGRSDIWSLGVILYELLTQQRPFQAADLESFIHTVMAESSPSPRKVAPHLPEALERICVRCLKQSPDERYGTAGELADDLRLWLRGVASTV